MGMPVTVEAARIIRKKDEAGFEHAHKKKSEQISSAILHG